MIYKSFPFVLLVRNKLGNPHFQDVFEFHIGKVFPIPSPLEHESVSGFQAQRVPPNQVFPMKLVFYGLIHLEVFSPILFPVGKVFHDTKLHIFHQIQSPMTNNL